MDGDGCWFQAKQKLAYAGAQGLTFRYALGLVSHSELPCLRKAYRDDTEGFGLTEETLEDCGVRLLGFGVIPTPPL